MTNTNAAATTEAPKAQTKVEKAEAIFNQIYTPGYKNTIANAKSQRAEFIGRAKNEAGLTQHGAATYFQNFSNKAKGEPMYKYSPKKKTTSADAKTGNEQLNETTNQANAGLADNNKSSVEGEVGKFRWMLVNAEGAEIASFPTRSKAQAEAKAQNLEWADRNADKAE